jgi:hypothetical protein
MNILAERALGPEEFKRRLEMRIGLSQMADTRGVVCK